MELNPIEHRVSTTRDGPWYAVANDLIGGWCVSQQNTPLSHDSTGVIADFTRREDAEFIASARTDVPDLVDRVRELEQENMRLRETTAITRYVVGHWHDAALRYRWNASHPLSLVLAALDGQTDPEQLGLPEDERPALEGVRQIVRDP